jgi:putative transposase
MNISDLAADYLVDKKEGMRHLTETLLNEVMQLEALRQIQAQPYERNGKRKAHRNGTRNRNLKTIHGEATLKKPQFREFPFRTEVFARYSRVEASVRVAVAESFLQGVSTRRVQKVVRNFGLENVTASEVSRIAKKLDEEVQKLLNRPIEEPTPSLYIDASYFKVRTDGRYTNKTLLITSGIRQDGYREILSAAVADSKNESCRESLFESLKALELRGVKMVISDGHKGIQKAVTTCFLGASRQMCTVHFMRAVLKNIPKKERREVAYTLKDALEDESKMQGLAFILDVCSPASFSQGI